MKEEISILHVQAIHSKQDQRYRGPRQRRHPFAQQQSSPKHASDSGHIGLLTGKHATEDDLKAIDKEIKAVVNESAEFAKTSPEPALEELWTDIYA